MKSTFASRKRSRDNSSLLFNSCWLAVSPSFSASLQSMYFITIYSLPSQGSNAFRD